MNKKYFIFTMLLLICSTNHYAHNMITQNKRDSQEHSIAITCGCPPAKTPTVWTRINRTITGTTNKFTSAVSTTVNKGTFSIITSNKRRPPCLIIFL